MAETCYRHPDRETRVACSNCDRPICPECMTPSPVGMRCPECSRQTTKVKAGPAAFGDSEATRGTFVLIGINVVAFLIEVLSGGGGLGASQANPVVVDFGLIALPVADGELYRLVTSGFLHFSFIHIAFNMYALFIVGRLLEPAIGTGASSPSTSPRCWPAPSGRSCSRPNSRHRRRLRGDIRDLRRRLRDRPRPPPRGHRGAAGLPAAHQLRAHLRHLRESASAAISSAPSAERSGALAIVAGERGMLGRHHLTVELAAIGAIGVAAVLGAVAVA